MAPKKMPKRQRPPDRMIKVPTFKSNPDEVFRLYQEAGRIPQEFKSWDDAAARFQALVESGISAAKAREQLGLTYASVAGTPVFAKTAVLDSKKKPIPGKYTFVNPRAINEDINPGAELAIRQRHGDDVYEQFKRSLSQDWSQFSELERVQVQNMVGKQFHRGHGAAASLRGGSVSQYNMYAEHGKRNVLHASMDRWPEAIMRDLGIPFTNIEAFYTDPNRSRLRTSHAIAIDDDWTAIDDNGRGYFRRPSSINPSNAEILSDKLDQLEAQGLSREGIDRALMERSATLSRENAVAQSGPVRLLQKGRTVTTKGVPKGLGKAGAIAGGAAVALALLSDNPAEAIPVAAESFTPLGDLQGSPEPAVTMVNVGGKLRPLNTDTNTLMDKPGYGLQQRGGKWQEVKRGTGVATKQQQAQIKKVASQVMPTMKAINATFNPMGSFITNAGKEAFKRVFGNREG